jgi:hypothetical protein
MGWLVFPRVQAMDGTCIGGSITYGAMVREDAKKGFQMNAIWDKFVPDHTLTQFFSEFHRDVTIPEK